MKKIIQIGKYYPPCKGGMEKYLANAVRTLRDQYELEVYVFNDEKFSTIERKNNVTLRRYARWRVLWSQPLSFSYFWDLYKSQGDIYHLHMPNPLAEFAIFLRKPSLLIISYHSDLVRQSLIYPLYKYLLNCILKRAHAILVTSQYYCQTSKWLKKYREKCLFLPLAIDLDSFRLNKYIQFQIEKIKKAYQKPILLFVGRLVYYKNLELLIKIVANHSDWILLIIGQGPMYEKLSKMVKDKNLENQIFLLPHIQDKGLIAYYHAASVFILPSSSRAESGGTVLLEALACGTPIVYSLPVYDELYALSKYNFLFGSKNSDLEFSIDKALRTMRNSDDKEEYDSIMQKKYSFTQFQKKLSNIYQSLEIS